MFFTQEECLKELVYTYSDPETISFLLLISIETKHFIDVEYVYSFGLL
jgi:hypothetical protein